LLVSFFKNSLPSLSPKEGSSIIVTLFEGEPYTLWNIRDLARHSGLEVKRSWRFQASGYPGYKHARTLGVVKGRNGEVGGGWKGEERAARSYEFVRKGEGVVMGSGKKGKEESSDDEDEADESLEEDESLDDSDLHDETATEDDEDDEDEDGD
jgi:25S rRNA (uracil2634-N3)-methyltransferase